MSEEVDVRAAIVDEALAWVARYRAIDAGASNDECAGADYDFLCAVQELASRLLAREYPPRSMVTAD